MDAHCADDNGSDGVEEVVMSELFPKTSLDDNLFMTPVKSGEFTDQDYFRVRQEVERRKLAFYRPYPKQLEFHNASAHYREILLRAGNQLGKTLAAAAQTAIFATGRYPAWWTGRVFKKAPVGWCAGVTGEVVRDSIQRLLIGDTAGNPGFIMKEDIVDVLPSRGVADLADTILVKHQSGGTSRIRLKYYEQGREKFQADTIDFGWLDEECDSEIYTEVLTRTNATKGIVYMTFTPLKGMSEVVRRFLLESSPDRIDINMTIMDALHIAPEERKRIIDSYPAHEKEARINGTPILGSGRIFPIAESEIAIKPFNVMDMPWYWMEIAGIDFGWDHPTAAAKILYDPQGDVIYVTNVYKRREATPLIHAAALKPWGKELQWAWPHDGLQHDKGSGVQLKEQYQQQGLKMLAEKATFDDERSNGVEAGIAEMLMRMESGRFKVFSHLTEFFEEFRLYHRKEGKVVKEFDDILSSVRAAVMMLRYAQPIRPPASMVSGGGNFKSQYNPLAPDYIKKSLTERKR